MTKQAIIDQTVKAINQLPKEKAEEISDFAAFICKRYEEHLLSLGIQSVISENNSFDFLNEDEELYTEADVKEKYNG